MTLTLPELDAIFIKLCQLTDSTKKHDTRIRAVEKCVPQMTSVLFKC